jgi:NADH-quinone oxidoreductase subunit J
MIPVLFYISAFLAVLAALNLILQKKTMNAALSLVFCLASLSIIYFILSAPFIGIIQLMVYAGAVMVLFLVVIMLLDPFSEVVLRNQNRLWVFFSMLIGGGLFALLAYAFASWRPPADVPVIPAAARNTESLAELLFQKYLLPFEAVSILILVAIVGAVVLAKKKNPARS